MKKLLSYLLTPIHNAAYWLVLLIFHPIQWLCLKLGGYAVHKRSVDFMNLCLVLTGYIVACRVKFKNAYELPLGRPIIFIANHQSLFDIPPLIWHLRKYHVKFVSKVELTRGIPSVSFNLRHSGGANINRQDRKQAISEIIKLAARMRENCWSTLIFPEGTRSRSKDMKPFAVGGVGALLAKVPEALVVPIAIHDSWRLTQYGSFPLSIGETLKFEVLKPIEPESKSAQEVVQEAESLIQIQVY